VAIGLDVQPAEADGQQSGAMGPAPQGDVVPGLDRAGQNQRRAQRELLDQAGDQGTGRPARVPCGVGDGCGASAFRRGGDGHDQGLPGGHIHLRSRGRRFPGLAATETPER
jgi:hypothetical protein